MATRIIFRDFTPASAWRNKYRRGNRIFEIWDANLHHGDVRPFACPEALCEGTEAYKTLYPLPECPCLGFLDERDIVQGFCQDQFFHIENGILRQSTTQELCNHTPSCRAGVPFNPSPPSASASCSGCDGVSVSYVITYITEHAGIQVEGPPSPPSNIVIGSGATPNASVSWTAAPPGYCIVATRLYRTEAEFGDNNPEVRSSEYVLVAEFEGSGPRTFIDNLSTSQTGQPLLTYDPMAFPAPTSLVSLARTEDGLAVADQRRVYISIPGAPQFTYDGVVEIQDTIRKIVAVGNTIYVLTDHHPVAIQFRVGEVLNIDRVTVYRKLPLTSLRSVAVYAGEVIFASEYSLYRWSMNRYGENAQSVLTPILSPEQWKNIDPSTVIGTAYEYGYIFTSAGIDYSMMLEFGEDGTDTAAGTSLMPISYIDADAFTTDHSGHIIYRQGTNIYKWDWRRDLCSDFYPHDHVRPVVCEQCDCCPWHIKLFYDNEGKNHFSHMRVEWDERSAQKLDISFHIHEFGREIDRTDTLEIISSRGFGIPFTNVSYQSAYAYIRGCGIMSEVRLATSAHELTYNTTSPYSGMEMDD